MKKLCLFLASLLCVVGFAGCQLFNSNSSSSIDSESNAESSVPVEDSSSDSSVEEPVLNNYTVTFRQYNQPNVVITVVENESLSEEDIPTPAERTGYTVVWEDVDLTEISQNIVVNAIETANIYTVTYDANGGTVEEQTLPVTYDSAYVLATPVYEDHIFLGWTYNGNVVSSAVWNIADDVTLVASWQEVIPNTYTVSFVQDGQPIKTVTVEEGEACLESDIPTPAEKTGYIVTWEEKDLSNITENITVNAVETPKSYTVTLEIGEGSLTSTSYTVSYDEDYILPIVTPKAGYEFIGWQKDGADFANRGKWSVDEENITLVAVYKAKTYTITLDVNGGNALSQTTIQVTYGEAYTLPTPTRDNNSDASYSFNGWELNGAPFATQGTWTLTEDNLTLVADWKTTDGWTSNY